MAIGTVHIQIVQRQLSHENHEHKLRDIYLITENDVPIRIGSGRYAIVTLAADSASLADAQNFYAVKFLKQDKDSETFSRNARVRFYEELDKNHLFGHADGAFVEYLGCSRIRPRDPNPMPCEQAFEKGKFRDAIEKSAESNFQNCERLSPAFKEDVQGIFFAMHAEEGTLEDLLFFERPWNERKIFSFNRPLRTKLDRLIEDKRDSVDEFLKSIGPGATLPTNCSGLEILNYIGKCQPQLRNMMILQLFEQMAAAVQEVHCKNSVTPDYVQEPADNRPNYLAHRDLKPGNFLFSYVADERPKVRISDLGFVAGTEAAKSLSSTLGLGLRDPVVLCPGSYLFRAPEQMSPCVEVRFELRRNDSRKASSSEIAFFDVGGVNAEIGDWVECQEICFVPENAPDPGQSGPQINKAKIERIRREGQRVIAEFNERIVSRDRSNTLYHVGYIIKNAGQHTDIFSLGCTLYFLATGGKNPEQFYQKCIEPSPHRNEDQSEDKSLHPIYDTCLGLALSLCKARPESIGRDLESYRGLLDDRLSDLDLPTDDGHPKYDWGYIARKVRPNILDHFSKASELEPTGGSFFSSLFAKHRDAETRVEKYGYQSRNNPSFDYYLRDVNGTPLPFPILYEVIRCMIRGTHDSYVSGATRVKEDESFLDLDLHLSVKEMRAQIIRVLASSECARFDQLNKFNDLGPDALTIFFTSRLCLRSEGASPATFTEPPREEPAPIRRGPAPLEPLREAGAAG